MDADGIRWGKLARNLYKGNVSYLSFFYEDVEYELYDNVSLYVENVLEPDIGKIIALWEEKNTEKRRMLIRWFLRPTEFINLDLDSDPKELFLAYGCGRGVTNENDLEAVIGKCKVLCTSKHYQNFQPTESDLKEADFFFCKVYDVDQQQFYDVEQVARKLGYNQIHNKPIWVSRQAGPPLTVVSTVSEANGIGTSMQREVTSERTSPRTDSYKISEKKFTFNCEKEDYRGPTHHLPSEVTKRPRELENTYEGPEKVVSQETDYRQQGIDFDRLKKLKSHVNEGKSAMNAGTSRGSKTLDFSALPSRLPGGGSDASMHKGDIQKDKPHNAEDEIAQCAKFSKSSKLLKLNEFHQGKRDTFSRNSPKTDASSIGPFHRTAMDIASDAACLESEYVSRNHLGISKENAGGREKPAPKAMGIGSKVVETKVASSGFMKEAGKQRLSQHFSETRMIKKCWEENLLHGLYQERVLILQNLNPSLTSMDIYDMLKHTFEGFMDAQMVPQDGTSFFGQALVIFENKSFAESAQQELEEYCLVQTDDNRPVVSSMARPPISTSFTRFPGHFALGNFRLSKKQQLLEEAENNVAASHCLETNTVKFEMAMEWRYLQETVMKCWKSFNKSRMDETKEVLQKFNQQCNKS